MVVHQCHCCYSTCLIYNTFLSIQIETSVPLPHPQVLWSVDNLGFQKTNIGHIFWTQPYTLCLLACYAIPVDICILYWLFEFFLRKLPKKHVNENFLVLKVPKLYSLNTIELLIGFKFKIHSYSYWVVNVTPIVKVIIPWYLIWKCFDLPSSLKIFRYID
jgi:hypothetical protein